MNEPTQEPKKNKEEEQKSNDSSSRSPGVTDRGASSSEKPSKDVENKQSTQANQKELSKTEDKD